MLYEIKIDDGYGDEDWIEVEADSVLEAAQMFWDEWHPTGWQWGVVQAGAASMDVDISRNSTRPGDA